jgi:hypothetical protein
MGVCSQPGVSQGIDEISPNFKPAYPQNTEKVTPGSQKDLKMLPKIIRIPTSVKSWFLQHLSSQKLVFEAPDVQILTEKTLKKWPGNKQETKLLF